MRISIRNLAIIIFCAITAVLKSQTYAAQNFTLASVISPETGTNSNGDKYSGCWGWTQPVTNKEYAIACSKSGTYWVDVTNPSTPSVSAYHAGTSTSGVWREVKTYQNFCYVICDDGSSTGFQIFDMSNLPASVTKVYDSNALFKRGHACWIDGNKLYVSSVTFSNNATSTMNVYSLATPTAPVLLRRLSQDYSFINTVHDMFVRNDTVYASCGYQGLYIFKFNSNNTFTQLGSLTTYSGSGYNHSSALTPNGQTLVFTDEVPAGLPLKTCDVTNLSNIQMLATYNQFTQTTPHNPFVVSNQYAFISSYMDGLQLMDISNPSAPFLAGYFDTYYQGGGNNNNWSGSAYSGQWGCYPFFPSKNIFACDQKNGLFMLKTHLYTNPIVTSAFIIPPYTCPNSVVTTSNISTGANSYFWSVSGTSFTSALSNPSITFSATGIYSITLTASNPSYTSTTTQTISVYNLQSTINATDAGCNICSDGSATVSITNSQGAFTYNWIPSGGNAANAQNLTPGCYTVNVTESATGCTAIDSTCISFLVTDIKIKEVLNDEATIYPNPALSEFFVNVGDEISQLKITNIAGKEIHQTQGVGEIKIKCANYPAGVYFIEIRARDKSTRKKLIKN
jgi:choice-of-anchor B domain-containing protein